MRPFALYRLPFEERYTLINGSERAFSPLTSLSGFEGFLLSKFNGSDGVAVASESVSTGLVSDLQESGSLCFVDVDSYQRELNDYNSAFERFYGAVESGYFKKLVLSRCHRLELSAPVSEEYLKGLFKRACLKYSSAFVYVLFTESYGVWFGCSPEVLIEGSDGSYSSVALAGTMPAGDGVWSEKNRREQACVANFVGGILSVFCSGVSESEPYSAEAGGIKHIKTDFKFRISNGRSVLDIAALLHPTPAVCGIEREAALRFIEENEGYDRSCYAGITGVCGTETHLYVNLRCVNFRDCEALLYAGGGLVKGSTATDEWEETESKLQTIKSIL